MIEKSVNTDYLKTGMYVSRLDRPWVETNFLFQGFFIKDKDDLDQLSNQCEYVYIDIERGGGADQYLKIASGKETNKVNTTKDKNIKQALIVARNNYKNIASEFTNVMDEICSGGDLQINVMQSYVNTVVEGFTNNSDAYLLLTKLKGKDDYTYHHMISCSIYAIALGKEIGFSKDELEELAIGVLLFDIGKIKLPASIMTKREPLDEEEHKIIEAHVSDSVAILSKTKGVNSTTIQIAKNHHERYDGNGYPNGKKGKGISLYSSIAGLVDCYDAMTSERVFAKGIKHSEVVNELYSRRNIDFKEELIEHFIQCLGTYPAGTLVELSTGEVCVVIQQNKVRRLRPKVMVLLNKDKESNNYFPIIDLLIEIEDSNRNEISIIHSLEDNAYGIDAEKFYL
jgi:HD-GYP domain-containing protein (c-di-GMP phosphodiesterase class II)